MVKRVRCCLAVDLLLEGDQAQGDQDGAEVLDEEDGGPGDLGAKVLEIEHGTVGLDVLGQRLCLILKCGASRLVKGQSYASRADSLLLYRN